MGKSKNILILGLGNIGRRHLEAILKLRDIRINLIDNNEISLNLSKEIIYQKNKFNLDINFFNKITEITEKIDLCIIATNSMDRTELILKLINSFSIKYLIVEKVVFNKISDFDKIIKKLNYKKIKSWVNYSRRYDNQFKKIKNDINNIDKIYIEVNGGRWGLGSNSVHFIDLLFFFKNNFKLIVTDKKLHNRIYKSKRKGYYEFGGTIEIKSNKGDKIILKDNMKNNESLTLSISYSNKKYIFNYSDGSLNYFKNKKIISSKKFKPIFQSNITNKIIQDIFKYKTCALASLKDSKNSHKVIVDYLSDHSNKLHNTKNKIYHIT